MKYLSLWSLASLLVLNLAVWQEVLGRTGAELEVSFLDVGQGDAIFITAPNGNQVLIDGGVDKKVLAELGRVMPFYDRSIDVVVATHPDADHIGGLSHVFERFAVAGFMEPGRVGESATYQSLRQAVGAEAAPVIIARRGMRLHLDRDVYFEILFPDIEVAEWESNEASIIGKLVYGETAFLLTGDTVKEIENYLVALDKDILDVDVLKVGHHGSKTSTSLAFAAAASPDFTVISAGRDNRYGHPHESTLETLDQASTTVLGTYDEGTITFISDGRRVWRK